MGPKLNLLASKEANNMIKPLQLSITEEFDQCNDAELEEIFKELDEQEDLIRKREKRKKTQFLRTNTQTNQVTNDEKRSAFAKKGMRRSRSNVEKLLNPSVSRLQQRGNSANRCNSILKRRGTKKAPGEQSRRVHFKPKKSVIFFRTASSVMRFKKNLLKQSRLRKKTKIEASKKK